MGACVIMTREEAATRAQANADVHQTRWYAISHDGRSYIPIETLDNLPFKGLSSYMAFEPRNISTLERQGAVQRQKGHTRR